MESRERISFEYERCQFMRFKRVLLLTRYIMAMWSLHNWKLKLKTVVWQNVISVSDIENREREMKLKQNKTIHTEKQRHREREGTTNSFRQFSKLSIRIDWGKLWQTKEKNSPICRNCMMMDNITYINVYCVNKTVCFKQMMYKIVPITHWQFHCGP